MLIKNTYTSFKRQEFIDCICEIGVVLAHGAVYDAASCEAQGKQFAEDNIIAFAVENTDKDELIAVAKMLKNEMGVDKVALVGASAGGASFTSW